VLEGGTQTTQSLRWSSVRDCGRKAVYEVTGAPARNRTLKEERQLFRGKTVGQAFVVALAHENRWKVFVDSGPDYMLPYPELHCDSRDDADVIAELKVQWELGVGHADLYVKQTDTILEVLSSQSASVEMIHSKVLQAYGYARAIDAQSIALAVVDPATLEEDRVIVTASSPQWDDLAVECDERVAQVVAWRDSGTIPARVCGRPSESWGHFCQYAAHCFEDWQADPVEQIESEEAQQLAIRLAHVKAKRREITSSDNLLEAEQKDIQEQLADLVPAGEWQVGGYLVKRSDRTRSNFKLSVAVEDSRLPRDVLDEFTTVSRYTVWEVAKTGPAAVLPDNAEAVPF
jgi:hypothetical protein